MAIKKIGKAASKVGKAAGKAVTTTANKVATAAAPSVRGVFTSRPIVATIALIALAVFLVWFVGYLRREIGGIFTSARRERNVDRMIENTPTQDGTSMTNSERNAYKPQARVIADRLQEAMSGAGTAEQTIWTSLCGLNGAELQVVFSEYGIRDDEDLFSWFANDLSDNFLTTYLPDDDGCKEVVCSGEGLMCTEIEAMRNLWQKSGIPITF